MKIWNSAFPILRNSSATRMAIATLALYETEAEIEKRMKEVAEIKDKAEKQKAEDDRLQWLWEEYADRDQAGAQQVIVHAPIATARQIDVQRC